LPATGIMPTTNGRWLANLSALWARAKPLPPTTHVATARKHVTQIDLIRRRDNLHLLAAERRPCI
jgi:hypothetical protein